MPYFFMPETLLVELWRILYDATYKLSFVLRRSSPGLIFRLVLGAAFIRGGLLMSVS